MVSTAYGQDETTLVANFINGNTDVLRSRIYLSNSSKSDGNLTVRVFTMPLSGPSELLGEVQLGLLSAESARTIKVEDLLTDLSIPLPYTDNSGNLTLIFVTDVDNVRGTAQVFNNSLTLAFGTYPLQEILSISSGAALTVLVANFINGNTDVFRSRVYIWNPSESSASITVRVFAMPLSGPSELLGTLDLGLIEAESARNIRLEDILGLLGIPLPYMENGGNLELEFTVGAVGAVGAAQVFDNSLTLAFGTYPLQEIDLPVNPMPTLSSLSPSSARAEGPDFNLTVTGSNFVSTSVVRWNGSDRPTTFVGSSQVSASISATDIATPGIAEVKVSNPAPGGGVSNQLAFVIDPAISPLPTLSSLSPSGVRAEGPDFNLTVMGSNFVSTSRVRWNGSDKLTTFLSSTQLTASMLSSDVAKGGTAQVEVFNSPPGGGTSNALTFTIYMRISLSTNDIIYDAGTQKIYASVPSSALSGGNSITPIDPLTGEIGPAVFIGSEPGRLAISDNGQYLYVALDGVAAVRRFDIASQTAGLQFSLGSDSFLRPYHVEDMEVLPGNPASIAVSRKFLGVSPRHAGVAIYDDGVQRAKETPGFTGSNVIEFSSSASRLYGYNNSSTEFGFRRMLVDASGVSVIDSTGNLISGFGQDIRFDEGLIYATSGRVIDPEALTLVGTYSASGLVVRPDSTVGRTFFLTRDPFLSFRKRLLAFDQGTFTLVGSLDILGASSTATSLIRWGEDGLAFRTSANQVVIIRTALVKGP